MAEVITDISQITAVWLTQILQRNGRLPEGEVSTLKITASKQTNVSVVYHLALQYSQDNLHAPQHLFLKLPTPNPFWVPKEVEFYQLLVPQMLSTSPAKGWLFPYCYEVASSPETHQAHFILEDLSETHFTNSEWMPPTYQLCEQVIDAYASFHTYWWEHPWLGNKVGEFLTPTTIDEFIETARQKLRACLTAIDTELSSAQRQVLEAVVTSWPSRRQERLVQGRGVTLVHRDPHPLNFLFPHDPQHDTVKLIDWQSWRIDTGTDDLAYLMTCHWPPEQIEAIELVLVKRYYSQLLVEGLENYSWDECWYDYQASIIRCLFFLVSAWSPAQWASGIWWKRVQYGIAAYERWQCSSLLNTPY